MEQNKKLSTDKQCDIHVVSKSFYCCKVDNNESKCDKQCQFCIDWVDEANEQQ